jgi:hypothetical protein
MPTARVRRAAASAPLSIAILLASDPPRATAAAHAHQTDGSNTSGDASGHDAHAPPGLKGLGMDPSLLAEVGTSLAGLRAKLTAGDAVTVRCLGGSITTGTGAADGAPDGRTAEAFPAVYFAALRTTFPRSRGAPSHDLAAVGVGGMGSAFFATCLEEHVPHAADLVVLDVSLNDLDTSSEATYEALLEACAALGVGVVLALIWRPLSSGGAGWRRSLLVHALANEQIAIAASRRHAFASAPLRVWQLVTNGSSSVLSPSIAASMRRLWARDEYHPSWSGQCARRRRLERHRPQPVASR